MQSSYNDDIELLNVGNVIIYDNDIERAIAEACEKLEIEDLKKEGQRPWKAVMQLVGKRIFNNNSLLRSRVLNIYNNNSIPTNNNSYNYAILDDLCDYYILLSNKYNKLVSTIAFSYFINIPANTIDIWKDTEPSSSTFKIWKKLQSNREDCLKDKNYDSNNVVGAISIGNTEYGWNMPGVRSDVSNRRIASLEDVAAGLKELNNHCAILPTNESSIKQGKT